MVFQVLYTQNAGPILFPKSLLRMILEPHSA